MRETGPLTSRAEKTPGNKSEQALKSTVSPVRFKGKARNSARFSVFSSSTYLETRLRGGACSQELTSLRQFPGNREKYREFFQICPLKSYRLVSKCRVQYGLSA